MMMKVQSVVIVLLLRSFVIIEKDVYRKSVPVGHPGAKQRRYDFPQHLSRSGLPSHHSLSPCSKDSD